MQNSGTRLVVVIAGLAVVLGGVSWWYRYEAAHRATQFWGAEAARLIAESEGLEVVSQLAEPSEFLAERQPRVPPEGQDISKARGQAHLRHALLSDRNYVWDNPLDSSQIEWRWTLIFREGGQEALVQLSDDLKTIGNLTAKEQSRSAYSCGPMTASLKQYFLALGLLKAAPPAASTGAE